VSLRTGKKCKLHTIVDNLIPPASVDVESCNEVLLCETLKSISLSNNTMSRTIDYIAVDVRELLIQQTKDFIAIQYGESTDVSNLEQFSCSMRFIKQKCRKIFYKPVQQRFILMSHLTLLKS
jgi:hypothetical protein